MFRIALVLSVAFLVCSSACIAAPTPNEIAARTLMGEAEQLIELGHPAEALVVLDKIQANYPETGEVPWAILKHACCYMHLKRPDDALAVARGIVEAYPGTLLACWAQTAVGEALVEKNNVAQGIIELLKVEDMLPDRGDLAPLESAMGILGRVCTKYIGANDDPLGASSILGLSSTDAKARGKVLALMAVYRSRQGRIDLANPILDRLAAECPGETSRLEWAKTHVATFYLSQCGNAGEFSNDTAERLSRLVSTSRASDAAAASAHLALARYHKNRGDIASATAMLESAAEKCQGTQHNAEILYELADLLNKQGRYQEVVTTFQQLAADTPLSGYVAPALYGIGLKSDVDRAAAIEALTKLAEGEYDLEWRGLALRRLASLYRKSDKVAAREFYSRSIEVLRQYMNERQIDVREDWRDMQEARIRVIEHEMQALDAVTSQEVR